MKLWHSSATEPEPSLCTTHLLQAGSFSEKFCLIVKGGLRMGAKSDGGAQSMSTDNESEALRERLDNLEKRLPNMWST